MELEPVEAGSENAEKVALEIEGSEKKEKWVFHWKVLVMACVVTLYLLLGGAVFYALEHSNEVRENTETQQALEEGTRNLSLYLQMSLNISRAEAANVTVGLLAIAYELSPFIEAAQTANVTLWDYGPAVFFAVTVVTTIGYGNISPSTNGGRTFFVFFAIIGIPLTLIFLGYVGEMLQHYTDRFVVKPLNKCLKKEKTIRTVSLLVTLFTGIVLLIFIPAAIFQGFEGWTYREGLYYCMVTLTTVGFGDFVAGQSTESDYGGLALRSLYKLCTGAWIIIGLAFIALVIADIQKLLEGVGEKVTKKAEKCRKKKKDEKKVECDPL